ncbi:MAG: transaldolase family protein [Spirochaetales bacterium]
MKPGTMTYRSKLHEMAATTPTQYWLDSCSQTELAYALENGAVGATTNPLIVQAVLEKELPKYDPVIRELVKAFPHATEDELAWKMIEHLAVDGARTLLPIFDPAKGYGRISIQTNTKFHRSTALMVEQALHFGTLAPNIQIKLPATSAGIAAIEEVTYRGFSINATVSFTVAQALSVAEAVERGLARRKSEGLTTAGINPVCTIMGGRTDDYLKDVAAKKGTVIDPAALDWCGVAVIKRAYGIYQERRFTTKLLGAAYRNRHHLAQLIGGDMLHTIPYQWQLNYNASDIAIVPTMNDEVPPALLAALLDKFPEFRQAYEPDGLTIPEFDTYGATLATLRGFYAGYDKLVLILRKYLVG